MQVKILHVKIIICKLLSLLFKMHSLRSPDARSRECMYYVYMSDKILNITMFNDNAKVTIILCLTDYIFQT